MANYVSPNQIQIQIELDLLVRPDTCVDTSQPCLLPLYPQLRASAAKEAVFVVVPPDSFPLLLPEGPAAGGAGAFPRFLPSLLRRSRLQSPKSVTPGVSPG